jgi:ribosome-associated toxin RatA of RatAB toxin-antitoxin module
VLLPALLASAAVVLTAGPTGARPALDKSIAAKVSKWKVVSFTNTHSSGATKATAIGLFNDIPEALLYLVMEAGKYEHFLPRVTESRVVKRRGDALYAVIHTDLPWPVKDCWVYIRLTRHRIGGRVYEVRWEMLNGTMKRYEGKARIEPWNEKGTRTLLTYSMIAEPRSSAPDTLIAKGLRRIAETITHRARLRLKALRKYDKLPKGL